MFGRFPVFVSAFALFFVIVLHPVNAQVVVHISKEKVSIEGIPYYIHIVDSAQTLYSISKAYNVSTETLIRENPEALYGLRSGQALKIPVVKIPEIRIPVNDTKRFTYHILQQGETIFALSRRYDIPEDVIRESNPDIDLFDIPVGTEIAIPRKQFREQPVYFRTGDLGFRLHKVKRGESLTAIARIYDVTVRELRSANRRVLFPKVGDYLRIPSGDAGVDLNIIKDKEVVDSLLLDDEEITTLFDGSQIEFTPVEGLDGSLEVVLLLPLYTRENSKRSYIDSTEYDDLGRKIYKTVKRSEEWIYPGSENFIEFYEGALLAVEKLKQKGLSIDLSVYDTGNDSLAISRLIMTGRLRTADLIIGPVFTENIKEVSDYARKFRIPVVSPLVTRNSEILRSNPYLFKVQPSMEAVQEKMAEVISNFYDYNLVFVHSDTAWSDNLLSDFKNMIYRQMRYKVPYEDISFRDVYFFSRSAYNDTINIIEHALSKEIPNLVIIASDDEAVMSEVIINVHTLRRNYEIEVIGYPALRWRINLDPEYFYDLGVMLITPNWVDYEQEDVKEFIISYRDKFKMEPHIRSFAWQSYDISYYFLSGIALHGNGFKYRPMNHHPDLLQVDYDFLRTGLTNGFENRRLYLIKYTHDMEVIFPDIKNRLIRE